MLPFALAIVFFGYSIASAFFFFNLLPMHIIKKYVVKLRNNSLNDNNSFINKPHQQQQQQQKQQKILIYIYIYIFIYQIDDMSGTIDPLFILYYAQNYIKNQKKTCKITYTLYKKKTNKKQQQQKNNPLEATIVDSFSCKNDNNNNNNNNTFFFPHSPHTFQIPDAMFSLQIVSLHSFEINK
eukprot:gene834-472_t